MALNRKSAIFYAALFVICLFLACLSTNYDYDLFARLIVGERVVEHGILPFKDFLSYTPVHLWYDHEWGSGVVFYLLIKYLGAFGLLLFQFVMMFFTAVFVIKTQKIQKYAFPPSLIFMMIFLVLYFRLNSELVRCQLFSFLFFSVFLYILEGTKRNVFKDKIRNVIWLLPLVTIFWNNVHGGVVSGLGLIAIYTACAILEKKPWKKYFAVLSASSCALIINPYWIKYLEFLISATTKYRKYVVEWWPFYAKRHFMYYLPVCLYSIFCYIALLLRTKKYEITKLIVLTVTLCLGLAHVKLLSLPLITTAALCYNDIAALFVKLKKWLQPIEKSLYIASFVMLLLIPLSSPFAPRADFRKFPFYETEFLKINNIKGNIVIPFAQGSYVSYKLYPDNKIYMDGRYEEVYYDKELLALRDFELAEPNWRGIIEKYPTDILMPSKRAEIYDVLKNSPDWTLIFEGKLCGIFVRKGSEKFSYFEPEYNIDYYRKTMFKHGDFQND